MISRPSTAAPILAVLAIALALLGAYVGGYFWLGRNVREIQVQDERLFRRQFPNNGIARAYRPLAKIESWITGVDMKAVDVNLYRLPTPSDY